MTSNNISILLSLPIIGLVVLLFAFSATLPQMITIYAQQPTTEKTTTNVTMVQGAQSPDNEQFYNPSEVTVKPGNTIIWKNEDTALHTATSGKDATPDGKFDTGIVAAGQSSKPITMPSEPGEYAYFCTLHPWMTGKVIVS